MELFVDTLHLSLADVAFESSSSTRWLLDNLPEKDAVDVVGHTSAGAADAVCLRAMGFGQKIGSRNEDNGLLRVDNSACVLCR